VPIEEEEEEEEEEVGFIIKKFVTLHGHMDITFFTNSSCTSISNV